MFCVVTKSKEKTGQPADDSTDQEIDRDSIPLVSRWAHIWKFWELFAGHPSYGIGESIEVDDDTDSDADEATTPVLPSKPSLPLSRAASSANSPAQELFTSDSDADSGSELEDTACAGTAAGYGMPVAPAAKKPKRLAKTEDKESEVQRPISHHSNPRQGNSAAPVSGSLLHHPKSLQTEQLKFMDGQQMKQNEFEAKLQIQAQEQAAKLIFVHIFA